MMTRAKRIYILMIKVKMLIFFFVSWYFLKEIQNIFFVFLLSYSKMFGRTRKSCGNTRLQLVFPQHFLFSQTCTRVSITRYKLGTCFLFLKGAKLVRGKQRHLPHSFLLLLLLFKIINDETRNKRI